MCYVAGRPVSSLCAADTPNLVVEVGSLEGHMVHGYFILLCGAIGCGASVGPEAPNGSFGAGVGAGLHRLLKAPHGPRAFSHTGTLIIY
jgi:H+/Cl- antiporter ClcA